MYKSKLFFAIAFVTVVMLGVVIYWQFEEMKTDGMLYSIMKDAP